MFNKNSSNQNTLHHIEKKCHTCGAVLEQIHYLEPDPTRKLPYDPVIRPPLCHGCWNEKIAYMNANGLLAYSRQTTRESTVANLTALACAVIGLQVADAVTTVIGTRRGWAEMNPLVAPVADSWLLLLLKIISGVCVIFLLNIVVKNTQIVKPIFGALRLCTIFLALVVLNNVVVLMSDKTIF